MYNPHQNLSKYIIYYFKTQKIMNVNIFLMTIYYLSHWISVKLANAKSDTLFVNLGLIKRLWICI